jgi:predicted HD superfamily hydrolase involved in NAD metabolism
MALPILPRDKEFRDLLRDRLTDKKARHSYGAAECMAELAPVLELPLDQAVTAGLLHDICRNWDDDKMLAKAEKYGLPVSPLERKKPNLLHGPVAAEQCRRKLAIDEPAIYEAIYWHTTGKPGLCRLGQALYFADFSEPNRKYPEAEEARRICRESGFDAALRYVAEQKIAFLRDKNIETPVAEEFCRWTREGCSS